MDENRTDQQNIGTSGSFGTTGGDTGATDNVGSNFAAESATDAPAESGLTSSVVSILERFGVGEPQVNAVREALKNVNVDQQLDRAREQVNDSINKAKQYARQNPGAVLAGVAVLVIGAGLIAGAALRRGSEKL